MRQASAVQNTLSGGCFTGVDVGNNADISKVLLMERLLPLFSSIKLICRDSWLFFAPKNYSYDNYIR